MTDYAWGSWGGFSEKVRLKGWVEGFQRRKREILTKRNDRYPTTRVSNKICLGMMRTSVGLKGRVVWRKSSGNTYRPRDGGTGKKTLCLAHVGQEGSPVSSDFFSICGASGQLPTRSSQRHSCAFGFTDTGSPAERQSPMSHFQAICSQTPVSPSRELESNQNQRESLS